jgi:hypothetical protein
VRGKRDRKQNYDDHNLPDSAMPLMPQSQNLAVPQLKLCIDTIGPKLGGVIDNEDTLQSI